MINEIKNWRSVRRFKKKEVEIEKINKILESGRRAPSWQNLQPWHFLAITDNVVKTKLAQVVATGKLVESSPLVIAILGNMDGFHTSMAKQMIKEQIDGKLTDLQLEKYLQQKIASPILCSKEILQARVLEQVSYATSFMLIEALNQSLGSCVIGGVENLMTENPEGCNELKDFLKIPSKFEILTILIIGYSDEEVEQRSRKSLVEISSYNKFSSS